MNESKKTVAFACTGGVLLLLAALTWWMTQPRQIKEFENVGQPFFADFESSSEASSLEVLAVDPETAELKSFRVEEKDGVWTIPSHYGYPAEAADRLARCSSSLIGLTRESLVGRNKPDHERFGVLDPLDEELLDPEAAGKRVTLRDSSGNVLADLIIGNQAEEREATDRDIAFGQSQQQSEYYVRHPDETQTYKIGLDLELSTKFSDWIRPDLLDLQASDLRRILVDNYELEEQADPLGRLTQLFKKQGDQMLFRRDAGFGKWTLEGLDEATEQLDDSKLNTAASTLANLKIAGVRPKTGYQDQQLLTPDLKLNRIPELEANPPLFRQIMTQLQNELSDYGFNLAPAGQGSQDLMLVSTFGELKAGTDKGVVYTLQFGNPIEGDEDEIEIGGASDKTSGDAKEQTEETESEPGDDNPDNATAGTGDDTAGTEGENETDAIRNRFLMIRVEFDESLLGDKPVAPEEPTPPVQPEGYVPSEPVEDGTDQAADNPPAPPGDGDDPDVQENNDQSADAGGNDQPLDDRPEEFKQYDAAKTEYDLKKTEYELALSKYEDELKAFNEKVEEGQRRVAELNERFGAWFYVISADNLESLQLQRTELVTAKEVEEVPEPDSTLPDRPNLDLGDETTDAEGG